jgi:hypothetical protein
MIGLIASEAIVEAASRLRSRFVEQQLELPMPMPGL